MAFSKVIIGVALAKDHINPLDALAGVKLVRT